MYIQRDKVKKIYTVHSNSADRKIHNKLLTLSEENTLRIYSKKADSKEIQMTSVLPIPVINELNRVVSIAYSPRTALLYILIENNDIWLYYTK